MKSFVLKAAFFVTLVLFTGTAAANLPVPVEIDPYFVGVKKIVVFVPTVFDDDILNHESHYSQEGKKNPINTIRDGLVEFLQKEVGPDIVVTDHNGIEMSGDEIEDDILMIRINVTRKYEIVGGQKIILGALATSFYRNEPVFEGKKISEFTRFNKNRGEYLFSAPNLEDFVKIADDNIKSQLSALAIRVKTEANKKTH